MQRHGVTATLQQGLRQGHIGRHEALRDTCTTGQMLAVDTQCPVDFERRYTHLPVQGEQASQMPLAATPVDHRLAATGDAGGEGFDLRLLAAGNPVCPEVAMVRQG